MKVLKILYVLFFAAIVILSLVLVSSVSYMNDTATTYEEPEAEPQTFYMGSVTIKLTDEFSTDYSEAYGDVQGKIKSDDTVVTVSKFDFDDYPSISNWTRYEFCQEVNQDGNYKSTPVSHYGMIYYEYDNSEGYYSTDTSHWWCFVFKTEDAFWTVDIGVSAEDYLDRQEEVLSWGESIEVYGDIY